MSLRRMVRHYLPIPVQPDMLDRIAQAAMTAPSAGNSQGVSVVVVTDPSMIQEIAAASGEQEYVGRGFDPWISSAPALIALCVSAAEYHQRYAEPDKPGPGPERWGVPYWWVDAGAALMAILVTAVDEGLGAGFLGEHAVPGLAGILGIPGEVTAIGVITIGLPAADRSSRSLQRGRKPRRVTIHYDKWHRHGKNGHEEKV